MSNKRRSAKKEFLHEKLTQEALYDAQEQVTADMDEERASIEDFLDLIEDWVRITVASGLDPESTGYAQELAKARMALVTRIMEDIT